VNWDPDAFTTTVPLLPGTHHIKFIVDDNWRLAQDLPTAVYDDGSLANYVSVLAPAGPSAPASPPAAVGSWATRVGGSAHAWQADARGISSCRQERHAQAHGWEMMGADVKGIED
jgi:hypothetical protein